MGERMDFEGPGVGPWRGTSTPAGFLPFPDAAVAGSVIDRFVHVAVAHGERKAISSPAGSWTYDALRTDVLRRAAGIRSRVGDGEPTPVAVVAVHDGPLVVTILAIVAAGHVVVVLDTAAPPAQTDHVIAECAPALVLHDEAHADWVAERIGTDAGSTTSLSFEAIDSIAAIGSADAFAPAPAGADSPLMLAFTSGTSGSSKAAVITHGVLLNLVRGATNALGIGPDDCMPMLFPTSLAVAAYPMFLPLLNGGTLATLDVRSVGLAPIAGFLEDEHITLAYMAPTVVRFLVDALEGRSFPELRMIALGGELVDTEIFQLTADLFTPRWMANGYGTTETGVVTLWVVEADRLRDGTGGTGGTSETGEGAGEVAAVPVGYPVPEVEITILDDHGAAVATGEAGEIAVASPYVFAGYWQHPELSAQVLADDPRGRAGWSLYRTGDYGRLDENGALVVLGRLDARVKVRGRPVVLGDVEAHVQQLDGVTDAAVTARTRDGIVELVAYVVPAEGFVSTTQLRATLLETDEAYRVPSRWVQLDELPRLPNGKVDRRSLPAIDGATPDDEPVGERGNEGAERETPAAQLEQERTTVRRGLQDIWQRLLPGELVGLDDDFVVLGGDSLMAAEMLLIVERELGATVPMGELVQARTIRDLADVVVRLRAAGAPETIVACVNRGDESARPRLWFVHDLQGSAYRVRHLAAELGADQPVWSFESPFLAGEPNHFTGLDTFVARYLTDLKAAQPEGPYWLGGYSFGGICAYEMARQLRADGDEVAFVGIVDVGPGYRGPGWHGSRSPFRPWFSVAKPPEKGAPLAEQARHYLTMVRQSPRRTARHLMVRSGIARVVDPMRFRADIRRHGRVRQGWRLWYAWEEHWKLAANGWDRGAVYPGRVHLFWSSDSASADATMGWGPLVDELVIERFPGDHVGILEPRGARSLAKVLRAALDDELQREPARTTQGGS